MMNLSFTRRQFFAGASTAIGAWAVSSGDARAVMPLLRVALVGCGRRGRWHADGLASDAHADLVAICDPSVEARAGIAVPHLDWDDLLREPTIDAVLIAGPEAMRTSLVVEALGAGKHVLSESPVAMTVHDCDVLDAALRTSEATFIPVCHSPFVGHWEVAAQLVAAGAVGEIRRVQSHLPSGRFPWGTDGSNGSWRHQSLGPAAEAVHHQWMAMVSAMEVAPETLVSSVGGRFEGTGDQADALLVEYADSSGARYLVSTSPDARSAYVHIRGSEGELLIEGPSLRHRRENGEYAVVERPIPSRGELAGQIRTRSNAAEGIGRVRRLVVAALERQSQGYSRQETEKRAL